MEEKRMSEQISAIAAFDEIVTKLREPPVVSADAREIAAQLRALADTVWAGRDEQVRGGTSMAMTEDERELVFELATALSGALVINYEQDDFRDSPIIDRIAQVAAMMEAHDWEVPPVIREALRKAAEAGRVIGVA